MTDWIEIGKLQDIPKLGSRVVSTKKGDIAVFRTATDEVFAVRDKCPHKEGPLSQGIVHGKQVTCPLHNWIIDLENGEAVAPDVGCVNRFPVMVEKELIYLSLSSKDKVASDG